MHHRIMLGLLGAALATATAQAGWEYTSVTKAEGGKHAGAANNSVHALIDGTKARIEFVESGNPMMGKGTYLLTEDAGKKVYLVNPAEKTYSEWNMDAMMSMAGGMMGMMNIQIKDQKAEKLLEEKGERILGYPTTHYKFRTGYTMEMNIMGMQQTTTTLNEEELWTTTALPDAAFAFATLHRGMKSGNAELDKLIASEMSKAVGFPLRIISTHHITDPRGQIRDSKTTMEVTALQQVHPASSQFQLPADYAARDLSPLGALGAGADKPAGSGTQGGDNPFLKLLQQQMNKQP